MNEEQVREILDKVQKDFIETSAAFYVRDSNRELYYEVWAQAKKLLFKAICQLDTEVCPKCKEGLRIVMMPSSGKHVMVICDKCKGTGRIPKPDTPVKVRRLTAPTYYSREREYDGYFSRAEVYEHGAIDQLDLIRQDNPDKECEEVSN